MTAKRVSEETGVKISRFGRRPVLATAIRFGFSEEFQPTLHEGSVVSGRQWAHPSQSAKKSAARSRTWLVPLGRRESRARRL